MLLDIIIFLRSRKIQISKNRKILYSISIETYNKIDGDESYNAKIYSFESKETRDKASDIFVSKMSKQNIISKSENQISWIQKNDITTIFLKEVELIKESDLDKMYHFSKKNE